MILCEIVLEVLTVLVMVVLVLVVLIGVEDIVSMLEYEMFDVCA